jgi:hypothetical protein
LRAEFEEIRMRIFRAAALVALLAGFWAPASAQVPNINLMPDVQSKTPEQKEIEAQREKAYRESLRKIPDAKTSTDPWGTVRTAEPPKPAPAKTKTKTGSN